MEIKEKTPAEKRLEALKKKHPLVTDPRCFDLFYWIDPEPEYFKELDDDEEM